MATDFEEKTPCPSCGYGFDASSAMDGSDDAPEDGDVTVCISCGEIAIFVVKGTGLTLRAPTTEEREVVLQNPEVITAMFAVRAVNERRQ